MSRIQNIENKILIVLIVLAAIVMLILGYIWSIKPEENKTEIEEQKNPVLSDSTNNGEGQEIATIESNMENEDSESVSSQIGKTVEEGEQGKNSTDSNKTQDDNKKETKNNNEQVEEKQETKQEEKEPNFAMPVNGEIIKGFAKDNLVFSETLQEWITHQAIDIKSEARDVVKASANGTVTAIKNDPRYGLTVIVEHSAGFQTVYSNLLTAEYVVEGEEVKQGQTLGTVGSSAVFEISDESHLHFEMLKNSEYVDPSLYIK